MSLHVLSPASVASSPHPFTMVTSFGLQSCCIVMYSSYSHRVMTISFIGLISSEVLAKSQWYCRPLSKIKPLVFPAYKLKQSSDSRNIKLCQCCSNVAVLSFAYRLNAKPIKQPLTSWFGFIPTSVNRFATIDLSW